ncbi:MAG: ribonuclease H-like domain-containing protein [Chlorobi bacterium]|nr:ribonuclease H-like domain-containing protein [Chlorobiota bacterium]
MEKFLVIDIETSPLEWESFDEMQQAYLLARAETPLEQEERKKQMALAPLTGFVVCIGLYLVERDKQSVVERKRICLMNDRSDADRRGDAIELTSGGKLYTYSERAILRDFWNYLRTDECKGAHYITFNGRMFDFPFLMLRSAVLGVRPSENLLRGTRYSYEHHTDLLDEFTFYMPQSIGATRRYNLDFLTKAFGIISPKSHGVDGTKVAALYAEGEYATIAEYCLADVVATWQLYQVWERYLKF